MPPACLAAPGGSCLPSRLPSQRPPALRWSSQTHHTASASAPDRRRKSAGCWGLLLPRPKCCPVLDVSSPLLRSLCLPQIAPASRRTRLKKHRRLGPQLAAGSFNTRQCKHYYLNCCQIDWRALPLSLRAVPCVASTEEACSSQQCCSSGAHCSNLLQISYVVTTCAATTTPHRHSRPAHPLGSAPLGAANNR